MGLTQAEIIRRLAEAQDTLEERNEDEFLLPESLWTEDPRPAAVLIPFVQKDNQWHVLFTRRTATLAEHSGQVAFPGGRADAGDPTPEATALREAYEEIALHPDDVRILGRLRRLRTITNYSVSPVVGAIPWPYNFKLALEEVSRIFIIPLDWLADPENREIRLRDLPRPYPPARVIYFKIYEEELLWGVSAQITIDLLKALKLL